MCFREPGNRWPATPRFPIPHFREATIQRVIEIAGGSKQYREYKKTEDLPIPEGAGLCPWCETPHPLRRHGAYNRTVTDGAGFFTVLILRLFCPVHGKTVSLLPSFLLPRKQHAAGVVADFFHSYVLLGLTLISAVARATTSFPSYQKGSFWRRCFEKNLPRTRTYLAGFRPLQTRDPTPASPRSRIQPALTLILDGFRSPRQAFEAHSRRMHQTLGFALL